MIEATDSIAVAYISPFEVLARGSFRVVPSSGINAATVVAISTVAVVCGTST
jgi:hypothetical protein